jgi:hypothetical protein
VMIHVYLESVGILAATPKLSGPQCEECQCLTTTPRHRCRHCYKRLCLSCLRRHQRGEPFIPREAA